MFLAGTLAEDSASHCQWECKRAQQANMTAGKLRLNTGFEVSRAFSAEQQGRAQRRSCCTHSKYRARQAATIRWC